MTSDPTLAGDPDQGRVPGPDDRPATRGRDSTIADVARVADVAIGTVSRYLNGAALRPANRGRIETAIAALDYRRNALAGAMKGADTGVVGLCVPAFDDFHARILEQLARTVRRTGRALLTYCHSNDRQILAEALGFFASQQVDAIVMDGTHVVAGQLGPITARRIPILFYNDDIEGVVADRVLVDDAGASYRALRHLIQLGHRRLAILEGDLQEATARNRLAGFERALSEAGLPLPEMRPLSGGWTAESGYARMPALMAGPPVPTAIFASNYQIGIGALTWLKERGLRTPDDLSFVSFDDVPLFRLHEDGITAIAQPIARIADSVAELLAQRLGRNGPGQPQRVVLECDIILRGSTQAPAAKSPTASDRSATAP